MHTLKKIFLSSVPKLFIKMAAIALTSELDNFDIETSFEDFIKETQHKLLHMSNVQPEGTSTEITTDLSSFVSINFEAKEQEAGTIESFVEEQLSNQAVKEQELLFEGVTEEDAAVAVAYQDTKFSENELLCLEVLGNGFLINQENSIQSVSEDNFNYTENAFSFTQEGVTVVKSVVPTMLSLKKSMACKNAIRTAIDS